MRAGRHQPDPSWLNRSRRLKNTIIKGLGKRLALTSPLGFFSKKADHVLAGKLATAIKAKKSEDVLNLFETISESRPIKFKILKKYLLHYALLRDRPLAPAFVRYFAKASDQRKERLAELILQLRLPTAAKLHLIERLRELDGADRSVTALGILFHCEAGHFAKAHELIQVLEQPGRQPAIAERASRTYQRCMADLELTAPRDLGKRHVLAVAAECLSAAMVGFHGQDGILHILPSLGPGGAQKQFINLMTEIRRRGRRDRVFVLPMLLSTDLQRFYVKRCAELDVDIVDPEILHDGRLPGHIVDDPEEASKWLGYLDETVRERFPRIISAIYACRPRTVHCWTNHCNTAGGFAALVADVETIILGARSVPPTATHYRYDLQLYHRFLTASPRVRLITNSMDAKEGFTAYLGETAKEITCVYNGVDLESQARPSRQEERLKKYRPLGIPNDAMIVGGMFRLNHEKMPLFWLEIAKATIASRPDVYVVIIGDGAMQEEVEQFIEEHDLGRRIFLAGLTNEPLAWHVTFDLLLLTSAFEGTPNVLLEAQFMGVPVVARDVGGCAECFIPGRTGGLIDVDFDAEQAAVQVLHSLEIHSGSPAVSDEAKRFVSEKFDVKAAADRYLALYHGDPTSTAPVDTEEPVAEQAPSMVPS